MQAYKVTEFELSVKINIKLLLNLTLSQHTSLIDICSKPQPFKLLTATIHFSFFNAKKLLGILQTFQNRYNRSH